MTDTLKAAREFPIQLSYRKVETAHPLRIPWKIAELAYSVYASRYGSSQSLETLASRGGFYPSEMDEFLPDWRERCDETKELRERLGYALAALIQARTELGKLHGGSGTLHLYLLVCRQLELCGVPDTPEIAEFVAKQQDSDSAASQIAKEHIRELK